MALPRLKLGLPLSEAKLRIPLSALDSFTNEVLTDSDERFTGGVRPLNVTNEIFIYWDGKIPNLSSSNEISVT